VAVYELVVSRVGTVGLLFGMKMKRKAAAPGPRTTAAWAPLGLGVPPRGAVVRTSRLIAFPGSNVFVARL
jgi:hypothetical protein